MLNKKLFYFVLIVLLCLGFFKFGLTYGQKDMVSVEHVYKCEKEKIQIMEEYDFCKEKFVQCVEILKQLTEVRKKGK